MKKAVLIIILILVGLALIALPFSGVLKASSQSNIEGEIRLKAKVSSKLYGSYEKFYLKKLEKTDDPYTALSYISEDYVKSVKKIEKENNCNPVNASFELTDSYEEPFKFIKSKKGKTVDVDYLCLSIAKSLDNSSEIDVKFIESDAEITISNIKKYTFLRGEYTTYYPLSSPARKNNIKLAAKRLNSFCVEPYKLLSFNDIVGERTIEKGYENAHVILNGEYVDGIGGGVCQVSTTLYNASLISGMDVVKASRHSRISSYVPISLDAMVSKYTNLVMINPTEYPMYIMTKADDEKLTVKIYGYKMDFDYRLESEILKTIESEKVEIEVEGEALDEHTRELLQNADEMMYDKLNFQDTIKIQPENGYKSCAYRCKYVNNKLVSKEIISKDLYKPVPKVILREYIDK